jgi:hypothetical protein
MTHDLRQPAEIAGYTYGEPEVPTSPITLEELDALKRTVGLTEEDERYLRLAGDVLTDQAAEMVDTWRAVIAGQPHLAGFSAHPDGTPNKEYSAASHPRFARWVIDVCTRPYDQDWLDYQQEIALRHTRAKKNRTDGVESAEHIPLRYFLGFTPVILLTAKDFLTRKGHPPETVERMHAAWIKAVMLHVTLWTRPYVAAGDW